MQFSTNERNFIEITYLFEWKNLLISIGCDSANISTILDMVS